MRALAGGADMVGAGIWLWVNQELVLVAASGAAGCGVVDAQDIVGIDDPTPIVLDSGYAASTEARRIALGIGSGESAGVLVLDLNPLRRFDDGNRSFAELIGRTVSAAPENAHHRAAELAEQHLISDTFQAAMLGPASDLASVAARYQPAAGELSVGPTICSCSTPTGSSNAVTRSSMTALPACSRPSKRIMSNRSNPSPTP